jgi:aldehyde:ferredoxin oxidoreductase
MADISTYKMIAADLSQGEISVIDLDERILENYLGGLGLGIKMLYDETTPDTDPLSPGNVIIFAAGLLSGTTAPTNGKTHVVTKSPMTGMLGSGNFGGFWGPRLKKAGFEAIVIRGKSERLVYLWVDDDKIQLRAANNLWGKDCWETQDALKKELGEDISVVSIGPAGENLVKFACPVADYYHAAARSHVGCVMGSKNLKAIAVRGTKEVPIFDQAAFKEASRDAVSRIVKYPERENRIKEKIGLYYHIGEWVTSGLITSHNYQTTNIPPENDLRHLPESVQEHLTMGKFCFHCPMGQGCDLVADVKNGPYAGMKVGGINCSISYWSAHCGINSMLTAWKCRELCQRYGMDMWGPVPFVEELYQKGILTKENCDGLELEWGNETAIKELLRKIAYREGIGDVFAEGSLNASKKIGKNSENSAMTVKGLEVFGKDARVAPLFNTLGTMTNPRGGDEQASTSAFPLSYPGWAKVKGWSREEYLRWFIDYLDMPDSVKQAIFGPSPSIAIFEPDNLGGKAELVKWLGNIISVVDSIGMCLCASNFWPAIGSSVYMKLIKACTGWQMSQEELVLCGERIFNLARAYIVREGVRRKDDTWPSRFYKEPMPDGPNKGAVLNREKIDTLLEEYYAVRGWDKTTGIPTREKLLALGLDYVVEDLLRRGITTG